ncbi:hypothetical protein EYC80_006599 [Monilinia laxa]|uniref:Uncharacterized protein n=1 Tax=Monilinia laxa TaxID=61186 RepID=A0A5N6JV36_MONLA|nr:hypothetical protein EYC80_006599 [Monilinia laxa]
MGKGVGGIKEEMTIILIFAISFFFFLLLYISYGNDGQRKKKKREKMRYKCRESRRRLMAYSVCSIRMKMESISYI